MCTFLFFIFFNMYEISISLYSHSYKICPICVNQVFTSRQSMEIGDLTIVKLTLVLAFMIFFRSSCFFYYFLFVLSVQTHCAYMKTVLCFSKCTLLFELQELKDSGRNNTKLKIPQDRCRPRQPEHWLWVQTFWWISTVTWTIPKLAIDVNATS